MPAHFLCLAQGGEEGHVQSHTASKTWDSKASRMCSRFPVPALEFCFLKTPVSINQRIMEVSQPDFSVLML